MAKKIILTDVDEVLLAWADRFEQWVREEKGYNPDKRLMDTYYVGEWLDISDEEGVALVQEFNHTPELFGNLTAYSDALEYVERFHQAGYHFVAITAVASDDRGRRIREDNLRHVFGPGVFAAVYCVGLQQSKREVLDMYPPTIWVEDNWEHAVTGAALGHRSFIITRNYNRGLEDPRITRVDGWKEIYESVVEEVAAQ